MIERGSKPTKQRSLKTEPYYECESSAFELGKPIVKLPVINKKSGALRFRYQNNLDKSADSKDKSIFTKACRSKQDSSANVEQIISRKYSNNSQLQLLTYEELELCDNKSKKILPKIFGGAPSRQTTQRSPHEQFHRRLNRMKSEKKIDSTMMDLGSYKLGAVIGRGNYSIVKLGESQQGKKFAVKVYSKIKTNTPQRQENLAEQIKIMKKIDHPSIITFKQYISTEDNDYIVMQVFDNHSLLDFIKKQSNCQLREREESIGHISNECTTMRFRQKPRLLEPQARQIMCKILQAFLYLHDHGIAHRDIKLENVLIGAQNKDEVLVKIIDFGFSREIFASKVDAKENKKQLTRKNSKGEEQIMLYDFCGTPSYISPQIMEKKGYLGRASDIWALGVVLYFMTTGFFPFKVVNEKSDFTNSNYQELIQPNIKISSCLSSMLKKMLRNDPFSRPTARELLKDPWILMNE